MEIDLEQYYRTYAPMVMRRCRRLLGDEVKAQEAMQDTFVNLCRYRGRLAGTAPSSLLYRMATNVCLNLIRQQASQPQVERGEILFEILGATDTESRISARSILKQIFAFEKESTQAIAVMTYFDEMTLEEVAKEVGMSVSGVRKRLRSLDRSIAKHKESK